MTKPSDEEIVREWQRIEALANRHVQGRKGRLALRIARARADDLEARGVDDADIDRLFPEAPAPRERPVALTGDRPTGPLHVGHYVGSLKTRVDLQDSCDLTVLVADAQALTDNAGDAGKVRRNVLEVVYDYLGVGLDPERCAIVLQSAVPALAEMTMLYANLVTVARLGQNPTVRQEMTQRGFGEGVPAGFLMYPLAQAADITAFQASIVPVGQDQAPMIEQTVDVVGKVNRLAGRDILRMPHASYSKTPRLPGLDGKAKMSKSLGNTLALDADDATIEAAVKRMFTDPDHLRVSDPGRVEGNVVFAFLDAFDPAEDEVEALKAHYRRGGLGDGALKARLAGILKAELGPIRERRLLAASRPDDALDILRQGTRRARATSAETLSTLRDAFSILDLDI